MNKILVIGVGGLCKQLEYHLFTFLNNIVFLDTSSPCVQKYKGYDVINSFDDIPKDVVYFVVALSNPETRKIFTQTLLAIGLKEMCIIPDIYFPDSSILGNNTIILKKCLIEPDVKIGYGSLLNIGVTIHHDCELGDFVTVGPQATILGNVTIGELSFVGAGAIIKQGTRIGKNVTIGMGAVVLNDVPDNEVWVGNPARFLRKNP